VRDNAKDADLPRRIDGSGDTTVPAASAASPSPSASDGDLPGRIGDAGRFDLSDSAAAAAPTAGTQVRRTRLTPLGAGANCAGPFSVPILQIRDRLAVAPPQRPSAGVSYFAAVLRTSFALNSSTSA
jgi:hypothetical protein